MPPASNLLTNVTTGVIYQNPKPHVKSVHAYFPSVGILPNGKLLATYVLAEAFEAVNARMHAALSSDGGQTWQHAGRICPDKIDDFTSEFGKMAVSIDGQAVANLVRHDRSQHPDEGLANTDNLGFVPTELLTACSTDSGRTWSVPAVVDPPLVGPAFELCSPITFLSDGRWILPTSTWMDWDGNLPNGNRMVAFVSADRGRTWPTYLDVMHSPDDNLIFWESKIVELSDGRLVAVAWCFDRKANADLPNQYAVSRDGGATWSPYQSMGIQGQTLTPCRLPDDRIVCMYRRMDKPGLWAVVSRLEGDRWVNDGWAPLWGSRGDEGTTACEDNMADTFRGLKFGAPSAICLPDGSIFMAFWCYEQNISIIRWFKFQVADHS
jgi:sialidase-1